MRSPYLLAAAALIAATSSCRSAAPPPPKVETKAERPLSPAAITFNDTARFIAGLKGRPGTPYEALEKTPAWSGYAKGFDETWAQFQQNQAEPVRAFEQRELAPIQPKGDFVFYPFSGPDILYMTGFFPNRSTYVMVGLEPAGTMRGPADFPASAIDVEMSDWTKAMRSIFSRSFFVTSEMDRQFRGRVADGLLESICLLLARAGYTIEGIQHGNLNDEGAFVPGEPGAGKTRAKGVEVKFRRGPTGDPQRLFYFSTTLDKEFAAKPGFGRFLAALGKSDTLIKSASFVMHWRTIDVFRKHVLANSRLILQDDTGVPFRFFTAPEWNTKLYGEYSMPDKPFRTWYQKDLVEAFADPARVSPLGFSLGYGAGRRPSSMILARRVK